MGSVLTRNPPGSLHQNLPFPSYVACQAGSEFERAFPGFHFQGTLFVTQQRGLEGSWLRPLL